MKIHVIHHFPEECDMDVKRTLAFLIKQGNEIMATSKELVAAVQAVADEVVKFAPAVDALEAAVTAALAQIPGEVPAEVQADIDAAFAALQGIATAAAAAVADAADGVDEAKV